MDLFRRHGGHGHSHDDGGEKEEVEHGHGHGHQSEDGMRNHSMASAFWYAVLLILVFGVIGRLLAFMVARQRIKRGAASGTSSGSSSTAERILEGPKAVLSTSFVYRGPSSWLATIPWKKVFIIIVYALFISFLLTFKSIKHDNNYLERLGFRAAWVTVTQTPMPYLLAARVNPIGLILGTSYERINWFHRWASRIFIATATVHGGIFVVEWVAADFFWEELRTVSMVKWGIVAWFVLVWTLLSSVIPVRRWKYEFFVAQHILSTVLLLLLLLLHVPEHHLFSVWCAVGVFVFDVATRALNPVRRNLRLRIPLSVLGRAPRYAFRANVDAVDQEVTLVTIKDVSFKWSPGQHVLIWTPEFWRQSPHPFTIANIADPSLATQDVQLAIKTKTGITKELSQWAHQSAHNDTMRLFIAGPYGCSPNWRQYDSLVLIASSTGGSFTTPVLEDLISFASAGCLRKINALYIARRKEHVEPYLARLSRAVSNAKDISVAVRITVAITQDGKENDMSDGVDESNKRLLDQTDGPEESSADNFEMKRVSQDSLASSTSGGRSEQLLKEEIDLGLDKDVQYDRGFIEQTVGRPDIKMFIRTSLLSGAMRHAAVAVCAGAAIKRSTKQAVASVRYEGAAQGSEAQSVFLHIERAGV